MRRYVDLRYTLVKLKIGGVSLQDDLRRIVAVLSLMENED